MHVAPPEDGLYPVHQWQAAVMAQRVPEPRVDAFDGVVRRRPFPSVLLLHLDEGEQRALPDEPVQAAPGLAQALVGIGLLAVLHGELLEEGRPFDAPRVVLEEPFGGRVGVLGAHEPVGDPEKLDPRLQLGLQGRAALDLAGCVERASLDPRLGPYCGRRLGEPRGAVRDEHLGRRHAQHQRRPRARALALRQMPSDDVAARDRHEHHGLPAQPDTVQEHHVVELARRRGYRPDLPYPCRLSPEGRPARPEVGYGVLGQQPPEECREGFRGVVVPAHARRPAFGATPPLPAGLRLPVALHLGPAGGAFRIAHARFPSLGNFLAEK